LYQTTYRNGFVTLRRSFLKSALCGTVGAAILDACGGKAWAVEPGPIPQPRIDASLPELDALAQKLMASTGIPGMAIAVVQGGKPIFAKGYGVAKAGTPQAVDPDTVFQLASVSKSVGATVVARQVGKGTVAWDTPMRTLLPWFALSTPKATELVTIGDLYAHRSGLPDHAGDMLESVGYGRDEILHRLRYVPLDGFRTQWHYTNFGLTAAAEGVTVKSGQDWAALSEETIYQPLGMTRTSSRFADFVARPNHAVGHVPVDGKFVPGPPRDPDAQSPAGGVSSSVNDLAKWMSMMLGMGNVGGTQLIPAAALRPVIAEQMLVRAAEDGRSARYYGFGFNVGTSDAGRMLDDHSGAFIMGAATCFMMIPSTDLGIVVLTNAWPVGVPETLCLSFFDLVQFGKVQRDWHAILSGAFAELTKPQGSLAGDPRLPNPAPAQPLAAYTGTYNSEYYGPLVVSAEDGQLVLTLGPAAMKYKCTHWDGDVFAITAGGESATPGSLFKASFTATQAMLELFDADGAGLGTFTR
jgi:CubicO group peptidase (beta-lactamase class C family)